MRYRVNFEYGYVSFDEKDKEKAFDLYRESGINIMICEDIFDDGVLLEGAIPVEDLSRRRWNEN